MKRHEKRSHVLTSAVGDIADTVVARGLPARFNPSNTSFFFDVPDPAPIASDVDDDDADEVADDAANTGGGDGEGDDKGKMTGHAKQIAKYSKKFKKQRAVLMNVAKRLGIDEPKIIGKGTESDPFTIEGLDDVLPGGNGGEDDDDAEDDGKKKKAKPGDVPAETKKQIAKLERTTRRLQAENVALTSALEEHAVVSQIRAAAARHHAIDDDNGQFEDVVNAVKKHFRTRFEDDDENPNRKSVFVDAINSDGEEWENDEGEMMTVDAVVASFLARKPKFVESKFRSGPGAGGANSNGDQASRRNGSSRGASASTDEAKEKRTAENVGRLLGVPNVQSRPIGG